MRIALIAALRHGLREPLAGGLERHTADLAVGLRAAGHDVTVFASGDSDPALAVEALCPRETALDLSEAARADVSMLSERFLAEHHAYLHLVLDRLPGRFDVIHDNSLHHLPVAMARALDAPLVKVLHTPPTPWLESALALDSSATLVSVSHSNARTWDVPVPHIIHNGVDLDAHAPGRGGVHQVIWTGRITPEKGTHRAVEAARIADVDLAIAGPVSDERYFREAVAPLLDDRRRHLGHLARAQLAAELAVADVCLTTPAWDEPFGLVVAEALACGTPVAAFDRGAMAELITDDVGVLVPPDDVEALAAAIPMAASRDRGRCRATAVERWSTTRMVREYAELYAAVAA